MTNYYDVLLRTPALYNYKNMLKIQDMPDLNVGDKFILNPGIILKDGVRLIAQIAEVRKINGEITSCKVISMSMLELPWTDTYSFTDIKYLPMALNFSKCGGQKGVSNRLSKNSHVVSAKNNENIMAITNFQNPPIVVGSILYLRNDWRLFTYKLTKIQEDADFFHFYYKRLINSSDIKKIEKINL